jgi:hypothetical protein
MLHRILRTRPEKTRSILPPGRRPPALPLNGPNHLLSIASVNESHASAAGALEKYCAHPPDRRVETPRTGRELRIASRLCLISCGPCLQTSRPLASGDVRLGTGECRPLTPEHGGAADGCVLSIGTPTVSPGAPKRSHADIALRTAAPDIGFRLPRAGPVTFVSTDFVATALLSVLWFRLVGRDPPVPGDHSYRPRCPAQFMCSLSGRRFALRARIYSMLSSGHRRWPLDRLQ